MSRAFDDPRGPVRDRLHSRTEVEIMPKSKALAVRLPLETWDCLNEEARRKGLTLSVLARTKLMLTSEFDGPIQECIDDFSKRLGISRHEFVEAVLIDFMALLSTGRRGGDGRYRFLPQFVYTDRGLLRGRRLFEHLRSQYARRDRATGQVADAVPAGVDRDSDDAGRSDSGGEEPLRKEVDVVPDRDGMVPAHDDEKPGLPNLERARIEQAMFDRIMQHYGRMGTTGESVDEGSES